MFLPVSRFTVIEGKRPSLLVKLVEIMFGNFLYSNILRAVLVLKT